MNKSHIALLLPLALMLALTTIGCSSRKEASSASATPETALNVRVITATNRIFERRLTVQGTLEAKRFANVAARVPGNLDALWVEAGDPVEAGVTKLFQIDPVGLSNACTIAGQQLSVAQASLLVAEANAAKAEAEFAKATLDRQRYARLHAERRVSDNEFELVETQFKQASAGNAVAVAQIELAARQVTQAEASLAIAVKNLADSLAIAPLTGVVSRRLAEPGEQMGVGQAIVTIIDPSLIEVAAFIPARYYHETIPGSNKLRIELPDGTTAECNIHYRSPTINATLRTFEIKGFVSAESSSSATPGAMAAITLLFEQRTGIGVPSEAVLQRAGKTVVFVVSEGRAQQVAVTTGFQNGTCTEILKGLSQGAAVVVEGQSLLNDQRAVSVLD